MSEQTAQEPTMEEILASIRRIISEDDQPAEAKAEEAPAPAPEPTPEPEPSPALMDETPSVQAEEDVLELTERFEEPAPAPVQTLGDIDIAPRAETPPPAPESAPEPAPAYTPPPQYTTGAATSLGGNPTIEDLVRSILEPQIREWVAQNLDGIMRDITRDMVREKLERVFK